MGLESWLDPQSRLREARVRLYIDANIKIGISTLAFSTEQLGWKINSSTGFAKDVLYELRDRAEEDGTTKVHILFDDAAIRAIEDGSEYASDLNEIIE